MAYIGKQPSDITRAIATYDTYTGDGSTTTFDLTLAAGSANDIIVVVNNVRQEPGASKSYTLGLDGNGATTRVTFNVAPEAADEIYVINPTQIESIARAGDISTGAFTGQTALTTGVQGADTLIIYDDSATTVKKINLDDLIIGQTELAETPASDDVFLVYDTSTTEIKKVQKSFITANLTYASGTDTGDGSTVAFSINSGRTVEDVVITVNGFHLTPTVDYTISGTTLTFQTAPAASAEISIRYLAVPGAYSHADYVGDGSTTDITINAGRTVDDVIVIVNGLQLVPTTDYIISSTTLTFQTAPAASAEITVRYLRLS